MPVALDGAPFGTARGIDGAWQLTVTPTEAGSIVATVPGDSHTIDVAQPSVNPDISTWGHTGVTGSGVTEREIIEAATLGSHLVAATLTDVDDSQHYTWTIQAKRGVGSRHLRINDGGGQAIVDLGDGSEIGYCGFSEGDLGVTITGPDAEGFRTIEAFSRPGTGSIVRCYVYATEGDPSPVYYTGDGVSSIILRGVEIEHGDPDLGAWCGGQPLAILSPATCYEVAQKVRIAAPVDPAVYVDGELLGFAAWDGDGVYEIDWTPATTGVHEIVARAGGLCAKQDVAVTAGTPPAEVRVLMGLGQSNKVRLLGVNGQAPVDEAAVRVIMAAGDPSDPNPAKDFVIGASSAGSHGAGMVQRFVKSVGAGVGDTVLALRVAYGGWSVVTQGKPDDSQGDVQKYMLPFIATQLANVATETGLPVRVVGITWHQGEADHAGDPAEWRAAVESVFAQLRALYPDARFAIGEIHDQGEGQAGINAAAQALADAADDVRCVRGNTGIEWDGPQDPTHLDTYGAQRLGRMLVDALGIGK